MKDNTMKYGIKYFYDFGSPGPTDLGWMGCRYLHALGYTGADQKQFQDRSGNFKCEDLNFCYRYREVIKKLFPEVSYIFEVMEKKMNYYGIYYKVDGKDKSWTSGYWVNKLENKNYLNTNDYNDIDGFFETYDINFAFQYREYLSNVIFKNPRYGYEFEVRIKE